MRIGEWYSVLAICYGVCIAKLVCVVVQVGVGWTSWQCSIEARKEGVELWV